MTLPKTPLKRWLPSSSSPQYIDQGGGSRHMSFSPRKCPHKSSPSFDPKDDEVWLQEARVLLSQNALQTLIKALFGVSCRQHTGREKNPKIRARCYSGLLQ